MRKYAVHIPAPGFSPAPQEPLIEYVEADGVNMAHGMAAFYADASPGAGAPSLVLALAPDQWIRIEEVTDNG
jgi:hypothetical protein